MIYFAAGWIDTPAEERDRDRRLPVRSLFLCFVSVFLCFGSVFLYFFCVSVRCFVFRFGVFVFRFGVRCLRPVLCDTKAFAASACTGVRNRGVTRRVCWMSDHLVPRRRLLHAVTGTMLGGGARAPTRALISGLTLLHLSAKIASVYATAVCEHFESFASSSD